MSETNDKPVFYIVPHTHWEGAVFKNREQYLEMGLAHILRALALLKSRPDARYTLDQVCYVKPFLERYPEYADTFQQFVDEGRLDIVGGTDSMLDVNMPSGESLVRQILLGKGYFADRLGVDVTSSWQLDTFGHHAQMPQVLKLAGFDSFWFFRGVPSWETPTEFLWEALDGTRIPAFWMSQGYAVTYGAPTTLPGFAEATEARWHTLDSTARPDIRLGAGGADVIPPEEHYPAMVEAYNARPESELRLVLATPADYKAAVGDPSDWPVLKCEMNPVFQGIYSSRIELKQWTRELENTLGVAEKLAALTGSRDLTRVWDAWEPMLFNQAHDLMSGVMTDHVYEDAARAFAYSRQVGGEELRTGLSAYVDEVDTEGEGIPLVVFNALSWPRTDVVEARVGFADIDIRSIELVGPDGPVPVQITQAHRRPDGTIAEADVLFVAHDVPAMGHATYHVRSLTTGEPPIGAPTDTNTLENESIRVTVDPSTGAVTGLETKSDGWQALSGPGNIVIQEPDHGDFWEPYKPLDGGSRIAMTDVHPVPLRGEAVLSDEAPDAPGVVAVGPVMAELTVEHPFAEQGRFATRIRVYQGIERVDIHTSVIHHDRFVRYRVAFPTSIADGICTQEIPFGAIERPAGIEFPAQNWAHWGDEDHGLAVLNRGLPGNSVVDGTMLLSLFRSTAIVAYGFGGGYEPGMTSDTGFRLGQRLEFDYALLPHTGSWAEAGVHRAGWQLNCPLIAAKTLPHGGSRGAAGSCLEIDAPNVVLSAMKPSVDGSVAVRVYEARGVETPEARMCLPEGVTGVSEADLLERPGKPLEVTEGAVTFALRPFEIKTFVLMGLE